MVAAQSSDPHPTHLLLQPTVLPLLLSLPCRLGHEMRGVLDGPNGTWLWGWEAQRRFLADSWHGVPLVVSCATCMTCMTALSIKRSGPIGGAYGGIVVQISNHNAAARSSSTLLPCFRSGSRRLCGEGAQTTGDGTS